MTIQIFHASGERKPVLVVPEGKEEVRLPLLMTIGVQGGVEGFDTTMGRTVVVAAVQDFGQGELPVQVLKPRKREYETFLLEKGVPIVLEVGLAEETPFGLNPVVSDHVGIERI